MMQFVLQCYLAVLQQGILIPEVRRNCATSPAPRMAYYVRDHVIVHAAQIGEATFALEVLR